MASTLRDWPVDGTVGYEFLIDVGALFVDPAGEAVLTDLWQTLSATAAPFDELMLSSQLEQATATFAREVDRLRVLLGDDDAPIPEALAALPVYRTYVEPWSGRVADEDRAAVAASGMPPALARDPAAGGGRERGVRHALPADLAAGDGQGRGGHGLLPLRAPHGAQRGRRRPRPLRRLGRRLPRGQRRACARASRATCSSRSTHDTKRSADARARIGALASMPDDWAAAVRRWLDLTRDLVTDGAPDGAERYMLLQNVVAAWPVSAQRLEGFVQKSLREAKVHTTWAEPDEAYERAVRRYATGLLTHDSFVADLEAFLARLLPVAERHALGQLLLKLTVPGLPDVYGGDDLWFLALVDPDNRRPVDWTARREALDALRGGAAPTRETVKLWLIWRALDLRARRPEAFDGAYTPLEAGDGIVAFLRGDGAVLVAVRVRENAAPFTPPEGRWRDVLVGAPADYGLVLLERADASAS